MILPMPRKLIIANDIIANWEADIKCHRCNVILPTTNENRNKKYCLQCVKQKEVERGRTRYIKVSLR